MAQRRDVGATTRGDLRMRRGACEKVLRRWRRWRRSPGGEPLRWRRWRKRSLEGVLHLISIELRIRCRAGRRPADRASDTVKEGEWHLRRSYHAGKACSPSSDTSAAGVPKRPQNVSVAQSLPCVCVLSRSGACAWSPTCIGTRLRRWGREGREGSGHPLMLGERRENIGRHAAALTRINVEYKLVRDSAGPNGAGTERRHGPSVWERWTCVEKGCTAKKLIVSKTRTERRPVARTTRIGKAYRPCPRSSPSFPTRRPVPVSKRTKRARAEGHPR